MIGDKILEKLDELNMSQSDLAEKIGYTPKAVNNWVNGIKEPRMASIVELCYALNCSADWLLEIEG